jgi:ATP-dependent DNA helicase RecG
MFEVIMSFLTEDPMRRAAEDALAALARGVPVSDIENEMTDFKEDPGRRGPRGEVLASGPTQHQAAALLLADAAACMANSDGGVLIVGVDDATGEVRGTDLEPLWLRGRIHDLSERRLTCAVEEVEVGGVRLLVILAPPAQEPIRVRGKAKHRVGSQCVEIDASQWMAAHLRRVGFDWSQQASNVPIAQVRAAAAEVARRYLLLSGEERAAELAAIETRDLLRRLGALSNETELTNGGALLFTGEAARVLIDYRRREQPAGDSLLRLDRRDLSLLEAVAETEQAVTQANRVVHVGGVGLPVGQIRAVPELTVREALANAVAHRDWRLDEPITVEFVGDSLIVQSPGGFVAGVDPDRLLTTPARTRNPHLADLLRRLRIAEREGIGVDRMYREMIRLGHRPPEIVELVGPHVRCALTGGNPDPKVLRLAAALDPVSRADDLDVALIIDTLRRKPTVTADQLAGVLQKSVSEAVVALRRARDTSFRGEPLVVATARTARYRSPKYRFGGAAGRHFGADLPYYRSSRDDVVPFVAGFVRRHGRIGAGDYVELFGVSRPHAARVLRDLATPERGEILRPGREPNIGRDAHYVAGPGCPAGPAD